MTRTTQNDLNALPTPQIIGPYSRWPRTAQMRTGRTISFASVSGAVNPVTHYAKTAQR